MFNKKNNIQGVVSAGSLGNTPSVLSQSTMFSGEINSKGDLRIDGNVEGNIRCEGKVIIGPDGCVKGNIKSTSIELMGKINGDVIAYDIVRLKSSSYFKGEITAVNLEIEAGANFFGTCKMVTDQDTVQDKAFVPEVLAIE
ncbi:bactofilin family protein [Dysgonomonas termitidis]|jgi:cytoskeletal protein CcmA (bactofilin family)|uniref:Polymer-forming cytoskeletal protein n=1 Tax=Dysgonomonas termitidis TaxID=1516126 RepID=A0ABV9KUW2_9BACT